MLLFNYEAVGDLEKIESEYRLRLRSCTSSKLNLNHKFSKDYQIQELVHIGGFVELQSTSFVRSDGLSSASPESFLS